MKCEKCWWKYQVSSEDYYDASCGNAHCFIVGDVADNKYKYCPYCGNPINLVGVEEVGDD